MKFHEKTNFYEGYQLALQNAKTHVEVALAVEKISFGIANSHLILASEEAIKAEFLYRVSLNKDWLNEEYEFDELFKSHTHKHRKNHDEELFAEFLLGFFDKLSSTAEEFRAKNIPKEEQKKYTQLFYDRMKEWVDNVRSGEHKFDTNKKWWDSANFIKNLGFYLDIDANTGNWRGPFDITEKQFKESMIIVEKRINEINRYE